MAKIGINGFGRIGRMVLRVCIEKEIEVVAINDSNMNADYMVYLFMYDSSHGRFKGDIKAHDNYIEVDGKTIKVFKENDPKEIPWSSVSAEYIVEATGKFTTTEKASQHLKGGAQRVIITASSPDAPIFVYGVNTSGYDVSMKVICIGSDSINAAAIVLKVLHDAFCVVEAFVTTINSLTSTQKTVDGPSIKYWRDGRGSQQNIIPACIGSAKAIGRVISDIAGRVNGMTFRVPTPVVSIVDISLRIGTSACYRDIVSAIKTASVCGPLQDVLAYTDEDIVSSDLINCSASAVVDVQSGVSLTDKFTKIIAWYDNEYAFAHRIVDMAVLMKRMDFKHNRLLIIRK